MQFRREVKLLMSQELKGEVLRYDDDAGTGLILGADGIRYNFARADLEQVRSIAAGTVVGFEVEGGDARSVTIPNRPIAELASELVAYFKQTYSRNYANFKGRAGRKEYWGFVLIFWLIFVALQLLADLVAGVGSRGSEPGPLYHLVINADAIFGLVSIVPAFAVLVRRLHDIGWSGWAVLLLGLPTLVPNKDVSLAVIIIATIGVACIDSQPHENKYGPSPKRLYA